MQDLLTLLMFSWGWVLAWCVYPAMRLAYATYQSIPLARVVHSRVVHSGVHTTYRIERMTLMVREWGMGGWVVVGATLGVLIPWCVM